MSIDIDGQAGRQAGTALTMESTGIELVPLFAPGAPALDDDHHHHRGAVDMCTKGCNSYRPPRTHHCRQCNTCVMRMVRDDAHLPCARLTWEQNHHCKVLATCIGIANHRYYLQMLFYLMHASLLYLAYSIATASDWMLSWTPTSIVTGVNVVNAMACLAITALIYQEQFRMLMTNDTQFDRMLAHSRVGLYRKASPLENMQVVLGRSYIRWALPL